MRQADGTTSMVQALMVVQRRLPMYLYTTLTHGWFLLWYKGEVETNGIQNRQ